MEQTITYQAAMAEIERILAELESSNPDVDNMIQKVQRASELIQLCRQKLSLTDEALQQLFDQQPQS